MWKRFISIDMIIALLFLTTCTITDIRTKKIPLAILVFFGLIIIIFAGINGTLFTGSGYLQLLPGVTLLIIGFLTGQSVGYGDGMIILLIGILLGIRRCLMILFIGLILSAVVSVFILIFRKGNYRTKLPFVPFLLAAWGGLLIV